MENELMGELFAGFVLLLIGGIYGIWVYSNPERKKNHEIQQKLSGAFYPDQEKIHRNQLMELQDELGEGNYGFGVKFYRNSGHTYKSDMFFNTSKEALESVMSTFKRAKIDEVRVTFRQDGFVSLYKRSSENDAYNARAEGKRFAGVWIFRLDSNGNYDNGEKE